MGLDPRDTGSLIGICDNLRCLNRLPDRRERLAAAALQGLLLCKSHEVLAAFLPEASPEFLERVIAVAAVRLADALAAELDKPREPRP